MTLYHIEYMDAQDNIATAHREGENARDVQAAYEHENPTHTVTDVREHTHEEKAGQEFTGEFTDL